MSVVRGHGLVAVSAAVWLAAVGYGSALLWRYKLTAGVAAQAPATWPGGTSLRAAADRHTLVMFAHPKCACTRASLTELSRLVTRLQGALSVRVLFLVPDGAGDDWRRSDTWQRARELEGVEVTLDPLGREARFFGAATSGQTLLYDPEGRLVFSGGITASRGHEGDNAGSDRIITLVAGSKAEPGPNVAAVFGCSLHDPSSEGKR